MLVLQLKRFTYTMSARAKQTTAVDFAAHAALRLPGAPAYDLFGVACHSGSLGGGHYYSHCRHPVSGVWQTFNDSSVESMAAAALQVRLACVGGGPHARENLSNLPIRQGPTPYLLFYQRRGDESKL